MKILMIHPRFPDTFWSFKHALRFIGKGSLYPPLGLLTVAALLPRDWDIRLVDLNLTELSDEDLKKADYAFISATDIQRNSSAQVISKCKQSGLKTVAGGPLFTMEHTRFTNVDHFVLNEAELTLAGFLADLRKGYPKRIYTTAEFADIKKTPVPRWDLVDLRKYARVGVQFSRGCPYDCEFCDVALLFGQRVRTKTVDQVIRELDAIYSIGWRGKVFFVDDNFIGSKSYVKRHLLPALIEWRNGKKGVPFHTQVTLNLADDETLMGQMVEAGFDEVFIGIETPNLQSLDECNKKHNASRDLIKSIRRIQRAGLEVQGGFIVGFDHDTKSIFKQQVDLIQKSGIVTAMVGVLQAPTGTKLYERLISEGRVTGFSSCDNFKGTTNIIPKMELSFLQNGYRKLVRQLYSPEPYYRRAKTYLEICRVPSVHVPTDADYLFAFLKSIIRLGVFGRERFEYWKLMMWTILNRPRLLHVATTFAINGFHFRKVSELHVR
jgi:radical SAM superfamily enzyme YgiQ (UPF0313 family)